MITVLLGTPKEIDFNSVKDVLLSVKTVKAVHNLYLWSLTVGQTLIAVHVAVGKKLADYFSKECSQSLRCCNISTM